MNTLNLLPDSPRHPVLLVHGFGDTTTLFKTMSAYLQNLGWSVFSFNLTPNNGTLGLERLAQQVATYTAQTFGSQPFDLVGFSMGGIVSRYYLQRLGGIDRVGRFISISSPHHGTWTAYALGRPGCLQMRPNSPFLQDLNRDAPAMLDKIDFTSIWTPYDLMIVPANSSQMNVGEEIKLSVALHAWMVTDLKSLQVVADTLAAPLRRGTGKKRECLDGGS
ncbi:triacylglycerol lipase [Oscillatoriales cyanobacterium LEGE 11467]|uniref:Triacylglycerol lipase n=1 Tax=Zarconia navalis LEGE 11467 TaxID=1828826 RepID=A0A928VZB5_9CYAN|nr:triacylglycerol lipase [Zarconia navalis]MBE9040425.1 triacylglycerol lipase [Zarconia navalis LEGE 11467]